MSYDKVDLLQALAVGRLREQSFGPSSFQHNGLGGIAYKVYGPRGPIVWPHAAEEMLLLVV